MGDRSDPSNHRSIPLTTSVAKVLESLLNRQISKCLTHCELLSDHLYWFRKALSTGGFLEFVAHVGLIFFCDHGDSFVTALDVSKTFDRV